MTILQYVLLPIIDVHAIVRGVIERKSRGVEWGLEVFSRLDLASKYLLLGLIAARRDSVKYGEHFAGNEDIMSHRDVNWMKFQIEMVERFALDVRTMKKALHEISPTDDDEDDNDDDFHDAPEAPEYFAASGLESQRCNLM